MVSPVIDEKIMLDALTVKHVTGENSRRIQVGASLLLLDAYDRKVTRDQFIAALGAASSLFDSVGRFEMIAAVKSYAKENGNCATLVDIEEALASVTKLVEQFTSQCAKMATLVEQCPKDEDKVH
jgi:hypothetical protein